jgi:phage terminase small subunit
MANKLATRGIRWRADRMTPRAERFVAEYLVSLNATAAAKEAGYSARTARQQGARLLTNVSIAAAIQAGQAAALERAKLKLDDVVAEMALIGFANMADYMKVTPDGDPYFDLSRVTREQAAVISKFTVEDFMEGRGADARKVRRIRVELADKLAALISLGKHLGGFGSKLELAGPPGSRLEIRQMLTMAELDRDERRALRELLARRLQKRSAEDPGSRSAQRRGEPAR